MYNLKINNRVMPEPVAEGITINYKVLKSSNWGTTYSGETTGTIIGIKRELVIQFGKLNSTQMNLIKRSTLGDKFVPVEYIDESGEIQNMEVNFSDTEYKIKKYINGVCTSTGLQISGEEKGTVEI